MEKYLQHVESEFDRLELRYLELVDVFGVSGVHSRLRELREAQANHESPGVIAEKRKFLDRKDEWQCPVVRERSGAIPRRTKFIHWSELKQSSLPIKSGTLFLL